MTSKMEAAAKHPGMNPIYDGNGNNNENENESGFEDSCEFRERVQIEEDDTSMGTVNDCNDAPSANGLIQP